MSIFLNRPLRADNLFVESKVKFLQDLTGIPARNGLTRAIISENEIVNIVSEKYGHLTNDLFFETAEMAMEDAGMAFVKRTINRENRSFSADYILNDPSYHVQVNNGLDGIKPMLTFVNSYDGSCRTSGSFGYFREVCQNGLHISTSQIGFSVKHTGNITSIIMPEIEGLIRKFLDNEYYTLQKKFEVLAETPIKDLNGFVKLTADTLKLFKYEMSEKNNNPSANARLVLDVIQRESRILKVAPNFWIGYNAFNNVLHNKLQKSFQKQQEIDARLFEYVLQLAN